LAEICSLLAIFLLDSLLLRLEPKACGRWVARSSTNKRPLSLASGAQGGRWRLILFARHGDEVKEKFPAPAGGWPHKQHVSNEAAPRSTSTATLSWSSLNKVDGRPLPPSSSVMFLPGRRLQVNNCLQAYLPRRRPLCISAVGSRRLTPSGIVPGGDQLGCAAMRRSSGSGTGSDCFCNLSVRILCAKSLDWFVLFLFLVVLHVIVAPPLN
jgi:hypothetical protein